MEVKLFEVRDSATFMPMMAVRLRWNNTAERFLLRRAGYAGEQIDRDAGIEPYVIFCKLDGVEAQYDPFAWSSGARTIPTAHRHIIENWNTLRSGDVIDVQFLVGETTTAKESEALHGS